MAATRDKTAILGDPAPAVSGEPTAPLADFRIGLGHYALWTVLAGLSVLAGKTALAPQAGVVLLVGAAATNMLFLLIAISREVRRPPDVTIASAQCVMGITWATLFSFMSSGSGELVLCMYVSAILFARPRVRFNALAQLVVFATASYGAILIVKALLTEPDRALWPEAVSTLIFAGVMGLLLPGRHARESESLCVSPVTQEDPPAREISLTQAVNRRFMLDTLAREKGRADRSNNPFTICIVDVDEIDRLAWRHGTEAADLVLRRIAKRARGELRAMDGVNSVRFEHSIDRIGQEQFVVILPQTSLAGGTRCAERIRAAMAKYPIDGQYEVTISGGVAEYRRGETIANLLDRAESALSRARDAGGNRVAGYEEAPEQRADVIPLPGIRS